MGRGATARWRSDEEVAALHARIKKLWQVDELPRYAIAERVGLTAQQVDVILRKLKIPEISKAEAFWRGL